jgi:hypothetical protein
MLSINENIFIIKKLLYENEIENILDYIQSLKSKEMVDEYLNAVMYDNPEGKWATECLMNIDKRLMTLLKYKSYQTSNWKFLRYDVGHKHSPYFNNSSMWSLLVYLKNAELGGKTSFPELKITHIAEVGDAVFFKNYVLYGESRVIKGSKILIQRDFY